VSILKRVQTITTAQLNEWLEQSSDPVRTIDQLLGEQREQMERSDKLYRQMLVHTENLRVRMESAQKLAARRAEQAELAVKAGEDRLARLALQEKLQHEADAQRYRELYEESREAAAELREQLENLRAEYQEVLSKREYYTARMETLRLQKRMNDWRGSGGLTVGLRAFDRLEDQVREMELESRALREVRRYGQANAAYGGSADASNLERELDALKRKLVQQEGGTLQ
jgi:phage shock protein A